MESESVIDDQEPGQTIVDKISDGGFVDGIEIRQIIEILRVQNEAGVNNELSRTDAATAAMMVRNGLFTRLVMLVSRVYAPTRKHDMHVARAFELLKDSAVKAEIEMRGPGGSLDEALESWRKLKDDDRKNQTFPGQIHCPLGEAEPSNTPPRIPRTLFVCSRDNRTAR